MDWVQVANIIAVCVVLVFIVCYLLLAGWWRSQEGQNVVTVSLVVLALGLVGSVRHLGYSQLADDLAIVAWSGVAAAFAWRTYLLLRAQGLLKRRKR